MTRTITTVRLIAGRNLWVIPVAVLLIAWAFAPSFLHVANYKLPRLSDVANTTWRLTANGTLLHAITASVARLAISFVVGAGLGLAVGLSMATSRVVMYFAEPIVSFFQAVAGIAWIPLAIVWFGFGNGPVIFVVANAIFFIVLYNTVLGVESIPAVLLNAVRTMGAGRAQQMREVIIPGALVSVLTGLRSGLAFGWRALIAVELIAANTGIGSLTWTASRNYQSDVVITAILVVGVLWLLMERLFLTPIERRTIIRWGMIAAERPR